jgi:hypothetical protein
MERKLDEIRDGMVRLETASQFRHAQLMETLGRLHNAHNASSGAWLKVPIALALPLIIFVVMWLTTGDLRSALSAARSAG